MIFPIGVEGASVNRVPWVSIAIAAMCVVAFFVTWVAPVAPFGARGEDFVDVFGYWEERPYLQVPEKLKAMLPAELRAQLEELHREALKKAPDTERLSSEQRELDARAQALLDRTERSLLRRGSLVPARGLGQLGWLTHMFLHAGWLHLLGNLFFFYLVGPMLEDVWGRPLFVGLYLTGGLAAAIAHALLDLGSSTPMLGASGAVAACMGAFALRFATEKVRMAYFFWIYLKIFRGTFLIPAWIWGLLWFGREVVSFFLEGNDSGIAVMAHIGGFGYGFGAAVLMKALRIEDRFIAPRLEKKIAWTRHPGLDTAGEAAQRGDVAAARAAYQQVLAAEPENNDAQLGLAKLELAEGNRASAAKRLEQAFTRILSRGPVGIGAAVEELGDALDPSLFRPQLAYRVASALEQEAELFRPWAERFYAAAGAAAQGPWRPRR